MPRPGLRVVPHWRSGSEEKVAAVLTGRGVSYEFETVKLHYVLPSTRHTYTPDFILANGVIIEVKGRWVAADRQKMVLVRKQNPDRDLRILFDRPQTPINKGSKTTYASYCDKHRIPWAKGPTPPDTWLSPTL